MIGYYYLHTNGEMIYKSAAVVDSDPQYFDSDFVKKYWRFDSEDRYDAWRMVLEGLALGMNKDRAIELATKWKLTFNDCIELLTRAKPTELMKTGINIYAKVVLNKEKEDFWREMEDALMTLSLKKLVVAQVERERSN